MGPEAGIYAGRYTIVIPAVDDATPATPDGDGIATLVVDATGAVTLAGVLADGTKFLVGGTVSASGQLALYLPLYDGVGVLTGALNFRATSASDLDGALFWSKPAAFALTAGAVGSRYTAPAAGQSVLVVPPSADNTALALGDGDFSAPVTLPPNSSV